ncbi:MAG: toxin-antitoxin system YwqK family antitoxin [Bacteroidia bacterium]|jgi:antitoxin component YwqK of YwqJK toxin-antitoxin module|nr:toxin-antitoxin system YwqK family antitoxin [Bacteroidia bacterium]
MYSIRFCFILLALVYSIGLAAQQPADTGRYTRLYYENGKIYSEGRLKNEKPEGYWKTYYPNGKLKSEGNRRNFQLDSTWKFYSEKGIPTITYTYKNGRKDGPKQIFDENGLLKREEPFRNDTIHGTVREFFAGGKVQQTIPFTEGRENGTGFEFDTTGTIITITEYKGGFVKSTERLNRRDANGLKQGVWKEFYPNGKTHIEGRYLNDKKNGYFKEYNEKGNLLSITKWENGVLVKNPPELATIETVTTRHRNGRPKEVGNYKDGVPEGVFKQYDTSGVIIGSEQYKDGILISEGILDSKNLQQGHWKEYHETGELRAEGDYKNGVRVGDWVFYYPNGKTDQKGKYDSRGRPAGVWKWYYDNGQLLREENYKDGVREGVMTEYDEKGNVITQGEYLDGLKEGPWFFQMNDYREEGVYHADQRDGLWKHTYLTNGSRRFEGNYVNGQPDGKHTWWYENGRIWQTGTYAYGMKDGDWKYYEEEGILILTITFKDDKEIKYDGIKMKFEADKS